MESGREKGVIKGVMMTLKGGKGSDKESDEDMERGREEGVIKRVIKT